MKHPALSIRILAVTGLVLTLAASLCARGQQPTADDTQTHTVTVINIADNVHVALGYDRASMAMIEGDDGVVIIDALSSEATAAKAMEAFRAISDKPVKALILTHRHRDHSGGIGAVVGDQAVPVHQRAAATATPTSRLLKNVGEAAETRQKRPKKRSLHGVNEHFEDVFNAVSATQVVFQQPASSDAFHSAPHGGGDVQVEESQTPLALALSGDLISGRQTLQVAGLNLTLVATGDENSEQLYVWYADKGVLFSGDHFYTSFPAIHALPDVTRQTLEWIKTLDTMLLESPHFLVTSHGYPIVGNEQSVEALSNYRDTINLVLEETLAGISRGLGPDALVASLQLPPEYAGQAYLEEHFGKLEWAVRAIYADQRGWYDGNPTHLEGQSDKALAQHIADLSGGTEALFENGLLALDNEDYRWAAQLADYLISLDPASSAARHLKADALLGLAEETATVPARALYLKSVKQLRQQAMEGAETEAGTPAKISPEAP